MAAKKKAAKRAAPKKVGRPRAFDRAAVVADICAAISTGMLVKDACFMKGITRKTLHQWTQEEAGFGDAYARAREEQAHAIAEEALAIADTEALTTEAVARNRLRVDTRKWLASKIAPRNYGEKVTTEHTGEVKHEHRVLKWGDLEIPL